MMMPKPIRLTRIVRKMMRRVRLTASLSLLREGLDQHRRDRYVLHALARSGRDLSNPVDDIHALEDAPEHGVAEIVWRESAMIESGVVGEVDVELRRGAARLARARHREGAALVAQTVGRLVLDRGARRFLRHRRRIAPALDDVAHDNPVPDGPGVV